MYTYIIYKKANKLTINWLCNLLIYNELCNSLIDN